MGSETRIGVKVTYSCRRTYKEKIKILIFEKVVTLTCPGISEDYGNIYA